MKGFAHATTPTRTFTAQLKLETDTEDEITGTIPIEVVRVKNSYAERLMAIDLARKYLSPTCNHIFLFYGDGEIAAHIHDQEFVECGERAQRLG